ncbi:hypothetical protein P261_00997 [Lachnospiraceae bacterium TWA4]|nr:hypothetical protein P261_00997 [Lachnospiraceae bacterium TWA4]
MAGKFEATHEKIIEIGMELLTEKGFDHISVIDICKQANISRASFYQHFTGKEQLIAEYYTSSRFFSDSVKNWIKKASDPFSRLIRLQMSYIAYTCNSDHTDLISIYLSYALRNHQISSKLGFGQEMEAMQIDCLRKAKKLQIILTVADTNKLSDTIIMLHIGNLFQWCQGNGRFDRYNSFFWNLEALLCPNEKFRGLWKLEENFLIL